MPPRRSPFSVASIDSSPRSAFLSAARRLFAQRGFDGVSVKQLAEAAGHNQALINYHFKNKEGLYRECVMPLIGAGLVSMERTLSNCSGQQDFITRFELFVEDFVETHIEHEDLCLILKRDIHTKVVRRLYKEHIIPAIAQLIAFLKCARRAKLVRRDLDAEIAANLIMGCIFQIITTDRLRVEIGEKALLDPKRRPHTVKQMTHFMVRAMVVPCDPQ